MTEYQVGGSLNVNDSTYVTRKADDELYQALLDGEFCYVFNCRQMGKSSLRVRVKNLLEHQGCACVSLDMTNIGSQDISAIQWYKSIASEIWRGLNLMDRVSLKKWWADHADLSPIQCLNLFISNVVLAKIKAPKIIIFIDEIDSVLSLNFTTDDFFALIRSFYNARAGNEKFNRLSFALFGVATPGDLIRDAQRTPFNIGTAIELTGFTLAEAQPLVAGLSGKFKDPEIVLNAILYWTGGQPFLTQKLCRLAVETCQANNYSLLPGSEIMWVENLVQQKIIHNWKAQDEPEHLKTIRDRLLRNEQVAGVLLRLCAKMLTQGSIDLDDSAEQKILLLSNLVIEQEDRLIVYNPIYQKIFNLTWIETQLNRIRPFGREVELWLASNCFDKSRLLRGKALQEARQWANDHTLSQEEYQFLNASQEQEQAELEQKLELTRLQAIETKLIQEQKLAKAQKFLLTTIGSALVITMLLSITLINKYCEAIINEIQALSNFSQSLYVSERRFDALLKAIEATEKNRYSYLHYGKDDTQHLAESALRQAIYGVREYNRLSGHIGSVFTVDISPDDQFIVTGGEDKTIKLWQADGTLVYSLSGHQARIWDVEFSPDGQYFATASRDRTIKIWHLDGSLHRTLEGHQDAVLGLNFSPDGQYLATGSRDRTVKIWNLDGSLISSIVAHNREIRDLAYSPDGKLLVTASNDRRIKTWSISAGQIDLVPQTTIVSANDLRSVEFSPDGQLLAASGQDKNITLYELNGKQKAILKGHQDAVTDFSFSDDGQKLISVSWDQTIKIWNLNGTLLDTIKDHSQRIWNLALNSKNNTIATASDLYGVKLWHLKNPLLTKFKEYQAAVIDVAAHPQEDVMITASDDKTIKLINNQAQLLKTWHNHASVLGIAYSPDGTMFVSGHNDGTVKLWHTLPQQPQTISQVKTLLGHTALVWRIAFRPDSQMFATASEDNTIKLWDEQGKLLATLRGHQDGVKAITFSPDGKLIASGSLDGTIIIWNTAGRRLKTLKKHQSAVVGIDFSPIIDTTQNSQLKHYTLASASWDNSAKLWRISQNNNNQLTEIIQDVSLSHESSLRSISFSPNGRLIATAISDRTIKLWQNNGKLHKTLFGHEGAVWQVKFNSQGHKIISASEDKTVIVWDLERINNLDLLAYGCNWVQDYLQTNSEIDQSNICKNL